MELTVFCILNEKIYINSKQKIQNQIHAHFVTVDKTKKQDWINMCIIFMLIIILLILAILRLSICIKKKHMTWWKNSVWIY